MKRLVLHTCVFLGLAALLSAQLSVPQPGFARFSDGSIHGLQGLQANFIVNARAMTQADHASFSSAGGLTSAQGLIQLIDPTGKVLASYQSDESAPLLNIESSLQSAVVWLPTKHLLLTWNGTTFSQTPVDDSAFGGRITFVRLSGQTGAAAETSGLTASARNIRYCALQATSAPASVQPKPCIARASNTADRPSALPATADFFVLQAHASVAQVAVSLPAARLLNFDLLPGIHSAVFVQQGWFLSQDAGALIAQLPNGLSQTMKLSPNSLPIGDLTMERMSDNWLHVSSLSTGMHWAVHLQATKWSASLLPPPMHEEAK
jgi:hypothetical protein